jgi:hypothetical protein
MPDSPSSQSRRQPRKLTEKEIRKVVDYSVEWVADMLNITDEPHYEALDETLGAALDHALRQVLA